MDTFKDLISADVKNIFLNPDEFAEKNYLVNGRPMLIGIDVLEYEQRQKVGLDRTERVYQKRLLIYVAEEDYGPEPKYGSLITLQKEGGSEKEYTVTACADEDGLYSVSLEVNR